MEQADNVMAGHCAMSVGTKDLTTSLKISDCREDLCVRKSEALDDTARNIL